MKNIVTYSVLVILSLIGCSPESLSLGNEEKQRSSYNKALKVLSWDCSDFDTEYYLSGTLAGEEICFGEGVDGYESFGGVGQWIVTETGSITIGTGTDNDSARKFLSFGFLNRLSDGHLTPSLYIGSTLRPNHFNIHDLIQLDLQKQNYSLAENKITTDVLDGFFLRVNVSYFSGNPNEYNGSFLLNSARGSQEDSFFKITDIKISEDTELRYHTVTAQISCNMYHHVFNQAHEPDFYGRLEADLKIVIEEPLN